MDVIKGLRWEAQCEQDELNIYSGERAELDKVRAKLNPHDHSETKNDRKVKYNKVRQVFQCQHDGGLDPFQPYHILNGEEEGMEEEHQPSNSMPTGRIQAEVIQQLDDNVYAF